MMTSQGPKTLALSRHEHCPAHGEEIGRPNWSNAGESRSAGAGQSRGWSETWHRWESFKYAHFLSWQPVKQRP